ncbi:MAG: hypothetical protein EON54_06470 [Alcaligenaceae bacterium]|nr:MAG: hypothetical protein EON54_06470 [Alcaligenaceae bacterium]
MSNVGVKHWQLYVLKLEKDRWYVGITSKTPEQRFSEHKRGFMAARWTKAYKPLAIHDIHDLGVVEREKAEVYENRVTRKYMEEYGINMVRGGDLTDNEEYIARFGRFFTKDNWEVITVVTIQTLAIIYLGIDKYLIN